MNPHGNSYILSRVAAFCGILSAIALAASLWLTAIVSGSIALLMFLLCVWELYQAC